MTYATDTGYSNYTPPKHHTIADTCMLVVLERNRLGTSKRADKATEQRIRQQEGDNSITIIRHLFKEGIVRDTMRVEDEAYRDHKDMTAAWLDRGPRLLPAERFEAYSTKMSDYQAQLAPMAQQVRDNWHMLVAGDMRRREVAGVKGVSLADYPEQHQVDTMFTLEWRVMPVPADDDFRVQVPQHVKDKHQKYLELAVQNAQQELMARLLKPLQAAAEKLSVPLGEKGSVFRDTLVGNLRAALQQARSLNLGDDSEVVSIANDIEQMLNSGELNTDALRNTQLARDKAAEKLHNLASRFSGL